MNQILDRIDQNLRDLRQLTGGSLNLGNPGNPGIPQGIQLSNEQRVAHELIVNTGLLAAQARLPEQLVKQAFEQGWTEGQRTLFTTGQQAYQPAYTR